MADPRYLFRVMNKKGEYYSSGRQEFGRWNKTGKFLTKQALAQAMSCLPELKGMRIEVWEMSFLDEMPRYEDLKTFLKEDV